MWCCVDCVRVCIYICGATAGHADGSSCIKVHATTEDVQLPAVMVSSLVSQANDLIATELLEAAAMGATRALLGAGGNTKRVLVAGEFVRVRLSGVPGSGRPRSGSGVGGAGFGGVGAVGAGAGAGAGPGGMGAGAGAGGDAVDVSAWRWGQPIMRTLRTMELLRGIMPIRATLGGVNEVDGTTWGTVTFNEPQHAQRLVLISGTVVGGSVITAVPAEDTPGSGGGAQQSRQVVVSWVPGKSLGVGYLEFDSAEDFELLMAVFAGEGSFRVLGHKVVLSKYQDKVVAVSNLKNSIDEEVRVWWNGCVLWRAFRCAGSIGWFLFAHLQTHHLCLWFVFFSIFSRGVLCHHVQGLFQSFKEYQQHGALRDYRIARAEPMAEAMVVGHLHRMLQGVGLRAEEHVKDVTVYPTDSSTRRRTAIITLAKSAQVHTALTALNTQSSPFGTGLLQATANNHASVTIEPDM